MKIGIIGLGFVGQIHSKIMESLKSDIEYYVYDITPNIAEEFEKNNNCKATNTIEELFNNVDAVIVATPTFTHYNLVIEATKRGKHVLCEKPMAIQIGEAIEMFDMSKEKNLICSIGFNYRFFEITEILKRNNEIGKIKDIHIEIKRLFRNDWHTKENGVLADLGIHLIDFIYYICNEEIKLSTCKIKQKYIDDWDYDTSVSGKLESGIWFELCASRLKDDEKVRFAFEITGENGKFLYDSRQENLYSIEKEKKLNTYQFVKREKTDGFFDFTDSILRQDIEWIKAISNGNKGNIATFEDGIRAQKVLEFLVSKK